MTMQPRARCPVCHRVLGHRTIRHCPIDGTNLSASRWSVDHLRQVEAAVEEGGAGLRPVAYEMDASSWDHPAVEEYRIRCALGHTESEILSALDPDECDHHRHGRPAGGDPARGTGRAR